MGKKTKSKERLDVFYRLAKEQGYRSRASFKLIQINKKYNFLQKANVLIDLCAAPGGWMQVASKYMPSSSMIIGIDLDPIKPVPNCIAIQQDITTQECLKKIKQKIQHMKVDVVLNDGAPNVGSNWNKDAYNQVELVLHALKLSTQLLRKDGTFVTKIFRSSDYQNILWVMNKFFKKVEANKPQASRGQSAEIFVVCQGYLSPDYIDPKFFDPEVVFKENEADMQQIQQENKEINSIQKIFEKRKRRIIKDEAPLTMYKTLTLKEFMNAQNPYQVFTDFNKIEIQDKQFYEWIQTQKKLPEDFEEIIQDLRLLNKKQVTQLLKFRTRVNQVRKKEQNIQETKKVQDMEIEKEEDNIEKRIKKNEKKEEKRKEKNIEKFVKNKLITNENKMDDIEQEIEDFGFMDYVDVVEKGELFEIEDKIEDKEEIKEQQIKRKLNDFKEMSDNLEYIYEQRSNKKFDNKELVSILKKKKIKKNKLQNDNTIKEEQIIDNKKDNIDFDKIQQSQKWYQQDIFNVLNIQQNQKKNQTEKKEEHVKQQQTKQNQKEEIQKEDKELISENESDVQNKEEDELQKQLEENYEEIGDMDDDELAEVMAISRKMLRKKDRRKIIDDSYNRYNYPEDPAELPKWFYEDEKKHIGKIKQITKEDVQREKERLHILKNRLPKKVMEAKMRRKKKAVNSMKRAQNKAKEIIENDSYSGFSKAMQINKLYRKASKMGRDKKKDIMVARKFSSVAPRKKKGRKFAVVDKRLKKDMKNMKYKKINKKSNRRRRQLIQQIYKQQQ